MKNTIAYLNGALIMTKKFYNFDYRSLINKWDDAGEKERVNLQFYNLNFNDLLFYNFRTTVLRLTVLQPTV
jgi:hypothetical protein